MPVLGTGWGRRGLRLTQEGAGIAGAWLAAGICAGMPALLSALSALGAGALAQHAYMFPVFVGFVGLSTWLLHGTGRSSGRMGPYWLGLGSSVLAAASFWLSVTELVPVVWYGSYVGLAGLGAASVWAFAKAREPVSCLDEMVREAGRERRGFASWHPLARGAALTLTVAAAFYVMYKSVEVFVADAEATETACHVQQTCNDTNPTLRSTPPWLKTPSPPT
jgi:mercuric ion transport protein